MKSARISVDLDLYDIDIDIIPYLKQLTDKERFEVMSELSGINSFTGVDMMNKFLEGCNTGSAIHEIKKALPEITEERFQNFVKR